MIKRNDKSITKFELLNLNDEELNELFESITDIEKNELRLTLTKEEISQIFNRLEPDLASKLIVDFKDDDVKKILEEMPFDDSIALINELEEDERDNYLNNSKEILNKLESLKADFLLLHPKDVANKIDEMTNEERESFFNLFTAEELSEFFACLDEEDAAKYLHSLSDNKASDVLENMYTDDAVDIINELDEEDATNYLDLMDEDTIKNLESLSEYDEGVVASIMNTDFIGVDASMDVKEAMKILVEKAPDVVVINTLFVSENDKYIGTLDFRKLIVTKSPCKIKDITDINTKYCKVEDDIEYAIKLIDDYDIYALPVLDGEKIAGIVTIDDGFEALQDEREEDYNQLAGLTGEREENETIKSKIVRRIPWLSILIILDLFVCLLISSFEDIINQFTVLVLFQPVILGLSGNVGMQSLAVCVRSLSNNELSSKSKRLKHILLELRNGMVLGILIAVLAFVIAFLFLTITKAGMINEENKTIGISLVVSISIFASLSLSCMFGCLMPILFNSLHIDPSAASGPFITTLNDIIAISTYFLLAIMLLRVF